MPLDEKALRKPTFRPGREVVMADGQAWNLPLPMVKMIPAETDAGFAICLDLKGPDDFQALTKAYEDATEFEPRLKAEFGLGKALLAANYDLTFADVASILQFGFESDGTFSEGVRIRSEVMAIARGNAPKPEGDGDESSPTLPE